MLSAYKIQYIRETGYMRRLAYPQTTIAKVIFKPGTCQPQADLHLHGILKLILCRLPVYVFVCVFAPRVLITSGVLWHDVDPIRLVKKFYSCYMVTVVVIINGHGLGINTHCEN